MPLHCRIHTEAWNSPIVARSQWLDPETHESLKEQPPHVQILLSHNLKPFVPVGRTAPLCHPQSDDVLPAHTLMAIVTAIHNRVYQAEFEDETIFPVSE